MNDINDPNRERVDLNSGEREFKKLIQQMVYNLKVQHAQPEEVVIMQSDSITDADGNYDPEKAYFYIILNGDFKVSSLRFNKQKKNKDGNSSVV